jgi:hypothetical protein
MSDNSIQEFMNSFDDVPFGDMTTVIIPPGEEEQISRDQLLQILLMHHPKGQEYLNKENLRLETEDIEEYWDSDQWGLEPEDLKTINPSVIQEVLFVQKGENDYNDWLAVLRIQLNKEDIYLFLQAACRYTGFIVTIYASKSLHRLRTTYMSSFEEILAFGTIISDDD